MIRTVFTPLSPAPAGHYAQGIIAGGMLFISGQLPVEPGKKPVPGQTIEEQTLQVLSNLENILSAAGTQKNRVVKVTIYVTDIAFWEKVNRVYSEFFGEHRPARTIVPVRELHYGYDIEMDAIALIENGGS